MPNSLITPLTTCPFTLRRLACLLPSIWLTTFIGWNFLPFKGILRPFGSGYLGAEVNTVSMKLAKSFEENRISCLKHLESFGKHSSISFQMLGVMLRYGKLQVSGLLAKLIFSSAAVFVLKTWKIGLLNPSAKISFSYVCDSSMSAVPSRQSSFRSMYCISPYFDNVVVLECDLRIEILVFFAVFLSCLLTIYEFAVLMVTGSRV